MNPLRNSIVQLRSVLKAIRLRVKERETLRTVQIRLGRVNIRDVPNLDVETRWSSNFAMIFSCFQLLDVFEAMFNSYDVSNMLCGNNIARET